MTTAEWMALHDDDSILRDYFWRTTGAFSKNLDTRRDLYQEAWLRIGQRAGQKTIEYYMHQGFLAMNSYYRAELRNQRLERYGKDYTKTPDAIRKRIGRFFQKMSKKRP